MATVSGPNGLPASKWESLFKKVGIEGERLEAAKSERAKTTIIGNFLAQNVDRQVPIEVNGRAGKVTLRMKLGRAKKKHYYFEVTWDGATNTASTQDTNHKARAKSGNKAVRPKPGKTKGREAGKKGKKRGLLKPQQKSRGTAAGNDEAWE